MKKTAPLAAVIGLSAAAALAGVLAPAATAATPSTPAHTAQTSDQLSASAVSIFGSVTNTLPYAIVLHPSNRDSIRLEPGAKYPMLSTHEVKVYAADAPTTTLVADISCWRSSTKHFFKVVVPNLDGSLLEKRTEGRDLDNRPTDITGFSTGRVVETRIGRGLNDAGHITLGGRADLPARGSEMKVVNHSSRTAIFAGKTLTAGQTHASAFRVNQTPIALEIANKDGSSNVFKMGLSQGQPRWETSLKLVNIKSVKPALNVDVRDQLNKVLGTGEASDQINYTLTRGFDSNGKAHFTMTLTNR